MKIPISIASRLYRWLLELCPPDLIMDSSEAVSVFKAALLAEVEAYGWQGYWRFCSGALVDTLRVAAVEWLGLGGARLWRGSRSVAVSRRARRGRDPGDDRDLRDAFVGALSDSGRPGGSPRALSSAGCWRRRGSS